MCLTIRRNYANELVNNCVVRTIPASKLLERDPKRTLAVRFYGALHAYNHTERQSCDTVCVYTASNGGAVGHYLGTNEPVTIFETI